MSGNAEGMTAFMQVGFLNFVFGELALGKPCEQGHVAPVDYAVVCPGIKRAIRPCSAGFGAFSTFGDVVGPVNDKIGFFRIAYSFPAELSLRYRYPLIK